MNLIAGALLWAVGVTAPAAQTPGTHYIALIDDVGHMIKNGYYDRETIARHLRDILIDRATVKAIQNDHPGWRALRPQYDRLSLVFYGFGGRPSAQREPGNDALQQTFFDWRPVSGDGLTASNLISRLRAALAREDRFQAEYSPDMAAVLSFLAGAGQTGRAIKVILVSNKADEIVLDTREQSPALGLHPRLVPAGTRRMLQQAADRVKRRYYLLSRAKWVRVVDRDGANLRASEPRLANPLGFRFLEVAPIPAAAGQAPAPDDESPATGMQQTILGFPGDSRPLFFLDLLPAWQTLLIWLSVFVALILTLIGLKPSQQQRRRQRRGAEQEPVSIMPANPAEAVAEAGVELEENAGPAAAAADPPAAEAALALAPEVELRLAGEPVAVCARANACDSRLKLGSVVFRKPSESCSGIGMEGQYRVLAGSGQDIEEFADAALVPDILHYSGSDFEEAEISGSETALRGWLQQTGSGQAELTLRLHCIGDETAIAEQSVSIKWIPGADSGPAEISHFLRLTAHSCEGDSFCGVVDDKGVLAPAGSAPGGAPQTGAQTPKLRLGRPVTYSRGRQVSEIELARISFLYCAGRVDLRFGIDSGHPQVRITHCSAPAARHADAKMLAEAVTALLFVRSRQDECAVTPDVLDFRDNALDLELWFDRTRLSDESLLHRHDFSCEIALPVNISLQSEDSHVQQFSTVSVPVHAVFKRTRADDVLCIDFGTSAIAAAVLRHSEFFMVDLQRGRYVNETLADNKALEQSARDLCANETGGAFHYAQFDPGNPEQNTCFLPSAVGADLREREAVEDKLSGRYPMGSPWCTGVAKDIQPADLGYLSVPASNKIKREMPQRVIFALKSVLGKQLSTVYLQRDDSREQARTYEIVKVDDLLQSAFSGLINAYLPFSAGIIGSAVLTAPNTFTRHQKHRFRKLVGKALSAQLGLLNGDGDIRIISESDAAAYHLCLRDAEQRNGNNPINETVMVYDFGGGTLDLSLVEISWNNTGRIIERGRVLNRLGVPIAGNTLDNILARIVHQGICKALREEHNSNQYVYQYPLVDDPSIQPADEEQRLRARQAMNTFLSSLHEAKKQRAPERDDLPDYMEVRLGKLLDAGEPDGGLIAAREAALKPDGEKISAPASAAADRRQLCPILEKRSFAAGEVQPDELVLRIPRQTLESDPLLSSYLDFVTGDVIAKLIRGGGINKHRIRKIVFSGRGALWPPLRERIYRFFGEHPQQQTPPRERVFIPADVTAPAVATAMKEAVVRGALSLAQQIDNGIVTDWDIDDVNPVLALRLEDPAGERSELVALCPDEGPKTIDVKSFTQLTILQVSGGKWGRIGAEFSLSETAWQHCLYTPLTKPISLEQLRYRCGVFENGLVWVLVEEQAEEGALLLRCAGTESALYTTPERIPLQRVGTSVNERSGWPYGRLTLDPDEFDWIDAAPAVNRESVA